MPLQFKRFAECAILALALPAILGLAGCRDFAGATLHDPALAAVDAKAENKNAASSQRAAEADAFEPCPPAIARYWPASRIKIPKAAPAACGFATVDPDGRIPLALSETGGHTRPAVRPAA